jgi:hypothetical protein
MQKSDVCSTAGNAEESGNRLSYKGRRRYSGCVGLLLYSVRSSAASALDQAVARGFARDCGDAGAVAGSLFSEASVFVGLRRPFLLFRGGRHWGGRFSLRGRASSLRGMAASLPGMASSLWGNLRERTGNAVWSLSPARSDHSSAGESHLLGRGTLSAVSRRLSPSGEWRRREGETLSLCRRRDRTGRARSEPAAPVG